jgi:glycosyltransferase involved in cell wall biosynthesis
MNICILTTELNSVWLSMQEIIPSIEAQWIRFSKANAYNIDSILVDHDPCLKKEMDKILVADIFIVTAFNHKIAIAMRVIRQFMGIQSPFIFYLHGQATIGLWPLEELGVLALLHQGDVFISTCTKDKDCFDSLFEDKQAVIVPFQLHENPIPKLSRKLWTKDPGVIDFVFIGRISEQKNLHTLIYSLSLMKSQNFRLHLIGGEDHLGSPNMGTKSQIYLEVLKSLTSNRGLADKVYFHGFQERQQLHAFLQQQQYVFVSPSLHSDENFGMAAFWSLCQGRQALLTDWGGHSDFLRPFKGLVDLVPVSLGSTGPYLEINLYVAALEKKIQEAFILRQPHCPDYYQDHFAFEQFQKALHPSASVERLTKSTLLKKVLAQRREFKQHYATKVFYGYEDPLAQHFFKAYGAKKENVLPGRRSKWVPWVKKNETGFAVQDPHRGNFLFANEEQLLTSEFAHF